MSEITLTDCSCLIEIDEDGEVIRHHDPTCIYSDKGMEKLFGKETDHAA